MKKFLLPIILIVLFLCNDEPNCRQCFYSQGFPIQHERVRGFKLADFFPPKIIRNSDIRNMRFEVLRIETGWRSWFSDEAVCQHIIVLFNKEGMISQINQPNPEGGAFNKEFEWYPNQKIKSIRNVTISDNKGWTCSNGGLEHIDFFYDSIYLTKKVESSVFFNKDSTERKSLRGISDFGKDENGKLIKEIYFDDQGQEILQEPILIKYDEQNFSCTKIYPPRREEAFQPKSKEIRIYDENWRKLIRYEWYQEEGEEPSKWYLNYDEFDRLISSNWTSPVKNGFQFKEKYHYSNEGFLSELIYEAPRFTCRVRLIAVN